MAEETLAQELGQVARDVKAHLIYQTRLGDVGQRFYRLSEKPGPSLKDVRQELGECTRCKLSRSRKSIVFGVGYEKANMVLVGEAPGHDEDLQGEPFVGKAGALLTQILNAIGLKRGEVYITNVVKCRPPENRNPQPDEIAACEPFLLKQLGVIRPAFIVALGNFATQTLLKTDKKISQLRGRFYDYQGIKLLPTYHPAFLLRNVNMKGQVWNDFKLLRGEYDKLGATKMGDKGES